MSDTILFNGVEIDNNDPRFEMYGAVGNNLDDRIHHTQVSIKFEEEAHNTPKLVAIKPFAKKDTPMGKWHPNSGVQLEADPDLIDDVIDYLEIVRLQLMGVE